MLREFQRIAERHQTEANNPVSVQMAHVKDILVDDGDYSFIIGSAVLPDNRLIAVHKSREGGMVVLLDTQTNEVISKLKVHSCLGVVTVISKKKAVVTLLHSPKKILLLNVSDKLERGKEISVAGVCYGVAYSKNRLVVSYTRPPKLEIMDLSGYVMKKIEKDNRGNQLFQCPEYVYISDDGETIYVSDKVSNKLTSLTFDGVVKFVYTDSELRSPQGVCVDHHGNVYVCCSCTCSMNVHMLTADLNKIKVIQADGLDSGMWCLCHCQETNRLYVGKVGTMQVFQLS